MWLTLVDLRVHNPVDTSRGGFLTATEPYDLRKPLVVPGEVRREWIGRVTKPLQSMPGSQHGIGSTSDDFAVELSRELSHLQSCRMDALKQRSQSNADLGSSSAGFGAVPSAAGEAPGGKEWMRQMRMTPLHACTSPPKCNHPISYLASEMKKGCFP